MGFRYRKSINLGGGFRINLSKSGIGYSFGGKGFRYTRTARGTDRVTFSVPGTGISWSQESKAGRSTRKPSAPKSGGTEYLLSVENADADTLTSSSKEDFVTAIKRYRTIDKILAWMIPIAIFIAGFLPQIDGISSETATNLVLIFFMFPIAAKLLYHNFGKVRVSYEYDDFSRVQKDKIIQALDIMQSCSSVWQINDIYVNTSRRINAGTGNSVTRTKVKIEKEPPSFIKTSETCYHIKLKKENLYILPDMMIVTDGRKFSSVDLMDLDFKFDAQQFVEEGPVPNDARVVRQTWKYVNNDGTPDRRYNGNRQLPVCLYGKIDIFTNSGMNMQFNVSDGQKTAEFCECLKDILKAKMDSIEEEKEKLLQTDS